MDIELLKTFIEVTQVRHFGRAADNLFLTPAAVSARIRQLEQMLGVSLLHRIRGNIQMTTEGERLLPHAKKIIRAWSDTLDDLSLKIEQENRLTLGAVATVWHLPLPGLTKALNHSTNKYTVNIESHSHVELVAQVLSQQLDIAVLLDLPKHPELHTLTLAEVELALFAPTTPESQSPATEGSQHYIHIEWSAAFAAFHQKRFVGVKPVLNVTDVTLATQMMAPLRATTYLPFPRKVAQGKPVEGASRFVQSVYLVYKSGREHNPQIAEFLTLLGIGK